MACRRTQTGRTIYFVEQAAFRQWREEVTSWYKVITAESFAMERQATASKHRGRISTSKREGSTNSNKTYCHPPPPSHPKKKVLVDITTLSYTGTSRLHRHLKVLPGIHGNSRLIYCAWRRCITKRAKGIKATLPSTISGIGKHRQLGHSLRGNNLNGHEMNWNNNEAKVINCSTRELKKKGSYRSVP